MNDMKIQQEEQLILNAKQKGRIATLGIYTKLSGPGWLQSAITLGGGSLAGSLYLGVLGGAALLWLQPIAMIMGVIMLSAISYVVLSTGERPFQAVNRHVNPVLGWGWALATLMANLVWALPQFSLGTAAATQNLFPVLGNGLGGKVVVCLSILVICTAVVLMYDRGSKGVKMFEGLLKLMVGAIVLCFFGVVIKMYGSGVIDTGWILGGFVPDLSLLSSPADTFQPFLQAVDGKFQEFWNDMIVTQQRRVMITAASTAVGINMTFLLPYSMLKRGWNKTFRGLAVFDLSTGLFVPFIIATSCVVIASATQFHARPAPGLLGETDVQGELIQPAKSVIDNTHARIKFEMGAEAFDKLTDKEKAQRVAALPEADKRMAAMLVKRDAFSLANSLSPLTGKVFAQYIFGFGVLAMAISSIIILMLINGFVVCEMFGWESKGLKYRIACLLPGLSGAMGPFFWKQASFWLAVPTSMIAMVVLPVAYFTFFMLMNQKKLLGDNLPVGGKRISWNVLMAVAAGLATFGSLFSLWDRFRWTGITIAGVFTMLVITVYFIRKNRNL